MDPRIFDKREQTKLGYYIVWHHVSRNLSLILVAESRVFDLTQNLGKTIIIIEIVGIHFLKITDERKYVIINRSKAHFWFCQFFEYEMKSRLETKELIITGSANWETEHNKGAENLQSAVDKLEKLEENQEKSSPGWQETFDAALDIVALISPDFEILKLNRAGYENIGKKREELIGKKCYRAVHGLNSPIDGCPCEKALKTRTSGTGEIRDHGRIYITTASPIFDKHNKIVALAHTVKDITDRKKTEEMLQNAHKDLERQVRERTEDLDRKNIALQEIIAQIEIEKKRMKEHIRVNIEKIVFPILETMKKEKDSSKYANLLLNHLQDLTSSFGIIITNGSIKLTSREIEICNLVKAAYKNKEIANLLDISCQTVEWHRKKIRSKLRIANRGINLGSYLHEL